MSRVAKNPVTVPAGVEVNFGTDALTVKGKNGALSLPLTGAVKVELDNGVLTFAAADERANMLVLCLVLYVHWLPIW